MLPACDLQAELPQRLQLPTIVCETVRLLQFSSRFDLCSQVLPGSRELRGPGLCSGSGHVCGSLCAQVRSGSGHVRCSLCSGSRDLRGSGLCSGSGHVCGSLCAQVRSGSGHVRCSLCTGSGHVRCSLCSGSGEVLRHRLRHQVLQCRSLRSCTLDLRIADGLPCQVPPQGDPEARQVRLRLQS